MAEQIRFEDGTAKVKAELDSVFLAWLYECGSELDSQVRDAVPKDTGQLQSPSSWGYIVDEGKMETTVGGKTENCIWNEYGTGEYAAMGNGRKGGWFIKPDKLTAKAKGLLHAIVDKNGNPIAYFTRGKVPHHSFENSYTKTKPKLMKRLAYLLNQRLGG